MKICRIHVLFKHNIIFNLDSIHFEKHLYYANCLNCNTYQAIRKYIQHLGGTSTSYVYFETTNYHFSVVNYDSLIQNTVGFSVHHVACPWITLNFKYLPCGTYSKVRVRITRDNAHIKLLTSSKLQLWMSTTTSVHFRMFTTTLTTLTSIFGVPTVSSYYDDDTAPFFFNEPRHKVCSSKLEVRSWE